jgi:hypothetical protein
MNEKKANIINHVDSCLKMDHINFYKFKKILCEKYQNLSNKLDSNENIFRNSRYSMGDNFKLINKNTQILKFTYEKIKQTNHNINEVYDDFKKMKNKDKEKNKNKK